MIAFDNLPLAEDRHSRLIDYIGIGRTRVYY